MRMVLLATSAWLLCTILSAAERSYQLRAAIPAEHTALRGLEFSVLTASQGADKVRLKVGIYNTTDTLIQTPRELYPTAPSLSYKHNGIDQEVLPSRSTLRSFVPAGGLPAKTMHTAEVAYALGEAAVGPLPELGVVTMQISHFGSVLWRAKQSFTPVDWSQVPSTALDVTLHAAAESMAVFSCKVGSFSVKADRLRLELNFRNASRHDLTLHAPLSGYSVSLVTDHGERLYPLSVAESLQRGLGPGGKVWQSGAENAGWVEFTLPDPRSSLHLALVIPEFPIVQLTHDADSHKWQVAARPETRAASRVSAMLEEERIFTDMYHCWEELADLLGRRKYESYLARFVGSALADQEAAMAVWRQIPISSVEFLLPTSQDVDPGNLLIDMRYTLAALPRDNVFVTQLRCSMKRSPAGAWTIHELEYRNYQPFWLLGYSQVHVAPHFLIFHKPSAEADQSVQLFSQQLNHGYETLQKAALPLKKRYAAFLIPQKDDFRRLTGRDADTYAGAASSAYTLRQGRIQVINQALYLNDSRQFHMNRSWGRADRQQTITHELVHLALAEKTRPWTPAWMVEGIAMLYADQWDRSQAKSLRKSGLTLGALSQLSYLGSDTRDPEEITLQYQYSAAAMHALRAWYGEAGLHRSYAAFSSELPANWAAYASKESKQDSGPKRLALTQRLLTSTLKGFTLGELEQKALE